MRNALLTAILCVASYMAKAQAYIGRIDSLLQAANAIGVFNGNILVAQKGNVIYQSALGFADSTKTKRLDRKSAFAIGSISKEFSNAAILLLMERKRLNIEDNISKYFPGLPGWADSIQINQLLQYTSGLPAPEGADSVYLQQLLKVVKLNFEPGKSYDYNNGNIILQQKIIEKVSGMDFYRFMAANFFKPLKMEGVLINTSPDNVRIAQSFDNDFNWTTTYQGTNDFYLTIDDLLKWNEAIDHYKMIGKSSIAALAKNFVGREGDLAF